DADVAGARVGQGGPAALVVGFDRRPVFGQGPLEADVAIHVAVGEVVDDLPDGPVPVAGIELFLGQAGHGLAQGGRGLGDGGDELVPPCGAVVFLQHKRTRRILGRFRRDLTVLGSPRQEKSSTRPLLVDIASNGNGVRGVRRSGAGSRDLLIDPCRPSRQGSINRSVVYALAEQFVLLLLEL